MHLLELTLFLKAIIIGVNSIIGAGSVVSKSIPNNEIWARVSVVFVQKIVLSLYSYFLFTLINWGV